MKAEFFPLGNTGLEVTRIGLGLAALGRPGYINLGHSEDLAFDYVVEAMERRTHRMLDVAYTHGVRYFDVARSYGRAEQFLWSWLEEHQPEDVVVASKWGYTYTANWQVETDIHEVKDHSVNNLKKQWEKSRQLMPWLKVYQIHSATFESEVLDDEQVLSFLGGLRNEGIKVGLSVTGPQQAAVLEKALAIEMDGVPLFSTVQATFNLLEQSTGGVLAAAAASGRGVIVKEALANGRLTSRNNDSDFQKKKQQLENVARRYEVGMDAVALAFVLAQPWVNVILSGAAIENHLLSNLQALKVSLGPDAMDLLAGMRSDQDEYWAERSALKWN